MKGLAGPVDVYELIGVSAMRSRLQTAAARGFSSFVGRGTEIDQLHRALEQAREGRGQVIGIVGEPGVGKSRLVFELTNSHQVEGWLILRAASVSYGKTAAYLPIVDLLKGYFEIGDRDMHSDIRENVTGKILALDSALEPIHSAILALLDVPVDGPQWQALDPGLRRRQTLDAVRRLLLRETQGQPVLLVFEDLHWIDSETQAFLDGLIERLPAARMLLLINYRPEYQHGWGSKTYYTQVRLDALPPKSSGALLDTLLGSDSSLGPLKSLLASRTEGNPLFLEESVRTLLETKALVGERAAFRMAQPIEAVQVPATVQAILASRIDRLPPEEKRLLETAAVIGKDFPFALLQATTGESEGVLHRGLSLLQSAELVYETEFLPELAYTFKHALTHDVTYHSMLQSRIRTLHAVIVDAIERLYSARLSEHIERLAHHAFQGELWEKAAHYLLEAGSKAVIRSLLPQAVAYFERGLQAQSHLPSTASTLALAVDLRLRLRLPLLATGRAADALPYLLEAERHAEELMDQRRLGLVYAALSHQYWLAGGSDDVLRFGRKAIEVGQALNDSNVQGSGHFFIGQMYVFQGRFDDGERHLHEALELLGPDRSFGPTLTLPGAYIRAALCGARCSRGQFVEGLTLGNEALQIAESAKNPFNVLYCLAWLTFSGVMVGSLGEVIRQAERGLVLAKEIGAPFFSPFLLAYGGAAYAWTGRVSEGHAMALKAKEVLSRLGTMYGGAQVLSVVAQVSALAGDYDDAYATARQAVTVARETKERSGEAVAFTYLGEVGYHAQQEDVENVAADFERALTIAGEIGLRPFAARSHLGLGRLYRRAGRETQACEHLAAGVAMLREMDMRFWLEKAEAEMRGRA